MTQNPANIPGSTPANPLVTDPGTGGTPGVNGVPSSGTVPTPQALPTLSLPDPQAIPPSSSAGDGTAHWEKRVNDLMSRAQRAENERDQVVARNVQLQQDLTNLREEANTRLNSASTTNQQLLDQVSTLKIRNQVVEGELRKAALLQQHPDLVPYSEFIPVAGTPEEQAQVIEKLKTIREDDLKKRGVTTPLSGAQQPTAMPPQMPPQQPQQGNPAPNNYFNLLGNRNTLPPNVLASLGLQNPAVGSNPALMNPAGIGSVPQTIDQLLQDAQKSGEPGAFERALEQAKVLAQTDVNTQMGRQ